MRIHVSVSKEVADNGFLLSSLKLLVDAGFQLEHFNLANYNIGLGAVANGQAISPEQRQVQAQEQGQEPAPTPAPATTKRGPGRPAKAEAAPAPAPVEPPAPAPAPTEPEPPAPTESVEDLQQALRSHCSSWVQLGGTQDVQKQRLEEVGAWVRSHPLKPADTVWPNIAKIFDATALSKLLVEAKTKFPVPIENPSVL